MDHNELPTQSQLPLAPYEGNDFNLVLRGMRGRTPILLHDANSAAKGTPATRREDGVYLAQKDRRKGPPALSPGELYYSHSQPSGLHLPRTASRSTESAPNLVSSLSKNAFCAARERVASVFDESTLAMIVHGIRAARVEYSLANSIEELITFDVDK